MSRPFNADPSERLYIYVPRSINEQVEAILLDPLTGRSSYGAKSKLVSALLSDWLRSYHSKATAAKSLEKKHDS